jgi:cation-transporting P-type ATPase C
VVFAVNTTAIGLNISGKIHPIMSAVIHNGTTIGVILRSIFQLR